MEGYPLAARLAAHLAARSDGGWRAAAGAQLATMRR